MTFHPAVVARDHFTLYNARMSSLERWWSTGDDVVVLTGILGFRDHVVRSSAVARIAVFHEGSWRSVRARKKKGYSLFELSGAGCRWLAHGATLCLELTMTNLNVSEFSSPIRIHYP